MSKIFLMLSLVLAGVTSVCAQNTVSFDNQSGEPALVKLVGPTSSEIEVPNGTRQGVQASAGRYFIKVRYGMSGNYHYARGQEFEITETATTRSETTITLHKVVAGNYESQPISETEFGAASTVSSRALSSPPTKPPETKTASASPKHPEGASRLVTATAEKEHIAQLDDTAFARLTARMFFASDIERDKLHIILQMASFKVADNEQSRRLLKEYNITAEQFEQEYGCRMFTKDNTLNTIL